MGLMCRAFTDPPPRIRLAIINKTPPGRPLLPFFLRPRIDEAANFGTDYLAFGIAGKILFGVPVAHLCLSPPTPRPMANIFGVDPKAGGAIAVCTGNPFSR